MCGLKWVFVLAVLVVSSAESTETTLFKEDFESGLRPLWKPVKFSGQTKYRIVREGSNSFLEGKAESSATGLAAEVKDLSPRAEISWKWKIDKVPPGASDDSKNTFDHTARLFVAFKTLVGPPRTINYVWANNVPAGKTFNHPSSGRSRFISLESGNAKAGQWISEKRNIVQDWKTLFGDDDPPRIVGLGFMTDSDGTESIVTGCYDDIVLKQSGASGK